MVLIRFGYNGRCLDGAKVVHQTIVAITIASDHILYGDPGTTSFDRAPFVTAHSLSRIAFVSLVAESMLATPPFGNLSFITKEAAGFDLSTNVSKPASLCES